MNDNQKKPTKQPKYIVKPQKNEFPIITYFKKKFRKVKEKFDPRVY